jgi:hypothetical protein
MLFVLKSSHFKQVIYVALVSLPGPFTRFCQILTKTAKVRYLLSLHIYSYMPITANDIKIVYTTITSYNYFSQSRKCLFSLDMH